MPATLAPVTHSAEPRHERAVTRVSSLELFFDLVFVFTITQVAHLFVEAGGALDILRAVLVLSVVWWMYGGYAWLTSNVGTERLTHRLLLLCAMAGFLVLALRIPDVRDQHGAALGLAYLLVVLVHAALFAHAPNSSARAILSLLPFNVALATLVLASGLVSQRWNWLCWVAAGAAILSATLARRERGFQLSPSHFVERHGLVILIALGESVIAIGTGAAHVAMRFSLIAAVVLGLGLSAAIWWSYFDGDDIKAEHALSHAAGADRARLAVYAYYHAHLVMIAGIVLVAAGMEKVIADAAIAEAGAAESLLPLGVAVYLAGASAFRRLLHIGPVQLRLTAAALLLVCALLSHASGSLAQLAIVMLIAEHATGGGADPGASPERVTGRAVG